MIASTATQRICCDCWAVSGGGGAAASARTRASIPRLLRPIATPAKAGNRPASAPLSQAPRADGRRAVGHRLRAAWAMAGDAGVPRAADRLAARRAPLAKRVLADVAVRARPFH